VTAVPEVLQQLQARYRLEAGSEDPVVRRVATLQLERLELGRRRARRHTHPTPAATADSTKVEPARWAHVLEKIVTAAGNPPVRWRGDGTYDCGHEPTHKSSSGTCLWVHPREGYWWCRACTRSGDALSWAIAEHGYTFAAAYAWLLTRYGPPFELPT
jgi:hypothetical protein